MADLASVHASRTCAAPRAAWGIERYAPSSVSAAAASFAREAVGAAAPVSPARAKALLFAVGRIAGFAEQMGLELSVQALLCEATIERFIACGTQGFSPATVRTLRSNLRGLARALEQYPQPRPAPLPRERAKAPYTPDQIDGYLRLAEAQSTTTARMRCAALICLGAGAGVIAGELRHVRGCDVLERSGGLLVEVYGRRARTVPVLARFAEPLIAAARFASDRLIIGGQDPARKSITDALTAALCPDPSLPRLQSGRLRSTWLCETAQMIGLSAFMAAAGVSCSQRLGDIAATLPRISESEMVTLLGGS